MDDDLVNEAVGCLYGTDEVWPCGIEDSIVVSLKLDCKSRVCVYTVGTLDVPMELLEVVFRGRIVV